MGQEGFVALNGFFAYVALKYPLHMDLRYVSPSGVSALKSETATPDLEIRFGDVGLSLGIVVDD